MEENNNFVLLNSLAINSLNREEYADFLTIMGKIRDRSISVLEHLKNKTSEQPIDQLRYSHDLDITLQYKLYKNNQKGERINLEEYSEIPILIKISLDKDPKQIISDIHNSIVGIVK